MNVALIFFFNDTATTEIYTLSLHDALPISPMADRLVPVAPGLQAGVAAVLVGVDQAALGDRCRDDRLDRCLPHVGQRSEEHTSELQSRQYLVCRLLLEKKKNKKYLTSSTLL